MMIKDIDLVIRNTAACTDINDMSFKLSFENLYKHDLEYNYVIDKHHNTVTVTYRNIRNQFNVPYTRTKINVGLFKIPKFIEVIDEVNLTYLLSMYYVITLNEYIKHNV